MIIATGCIGASVPCDARLEEGASWSDSLVGIVGLILETILSGASAVYIQYMFGNETRLMWVRNVHLSTLSIAGYALLLQWAPCDVVRVSGTDVVLVLVGAVGGILVALTVTKVGAVEKTIATSVSVLFTMAIDGVIRMEMPNLTRISSSLCVVLAAAMYTV